MARKIEQTLPVLRDEELTAAAGGSGADLGNVNLFGNQAVNSGTGFTFAGDKNTVASDHSTAASGCAQVDASKTILSLIAGMIPVVKPA